jgi:nickel/cobalt transporter (NicO) family protein
MNMRTCRKNNGRAGVAVLLALLFMNPSVARADTVASLLGNFTINQYCGLSLAAAGLNLHYVVVFGQLPALRELHVADANGDGVTSQAERDTYAGVLARGFAEGLVLKVDGVRVPLRVTQWTSSLPTEQGGFSLRLDVDLAAPWAVAAAGSEHQLAFTNENYAGRMGWHEIVVHTTPGLAAFNTNAFSTSLTGALSEALQSLPAAGPLDERSVRVSVSTAAAPHGAVLLAARPEQEALRPQSIAVDISWIARETRRLVDAISAPRIGSRMAILALLGALLLGAVHALSPGHGKTIVGAYLIGSRGTPRHAAFLGLTVTVTHTLGVFALGFATLYASRFIMPERLFPILSLISAALVLGMGVALLVQRTRAARSALGGATTAASVFQRVEARALVFAHGHNRHDGSMHSHGGGKMHSHLPPGSQGEKITWRSLLTLGISGGLVPCPAAMVLLLAAVALNKTVYGMLLVVAFSVGLAITLTAVGMLFLYARNRLRKPRAGAPWLAALPIVSAAAIIVLGLGLSFAALKSFGS